LSRRKSGFRSNFSSGLEKFVNSWMMASKAGRLAFVGGVVGAFESDSPVYLTTTESRDTSDAGVCCATNEEEW
jgi:hypothetical protein